MTENTNPKTQKPFKGMPGMGPGPRGFMPGQKAKNFQSTMKKLIRYTRNYWRSIILVFFFAIVSTVFSIVGPKLLGHVTNQIVDDYVSIKFYEGVHSQLPKGTIIPKGTTGEVFLKRAPKSITQKLSAGELAKINHLDLSTRPSINFQKIRNLVLFLIALYIISALFSYLQGYIMSHVSQKITYSLRRDISLKINRLPLKYFDTRTYGEVLSRVTNDVDTISQTLNQSLSQIITSVTMIIGIIAMMFSINWLMTLVTLIVLPVSFLFISLIVKKSQHYFLDQQNSLGSLNGHIEEMYGGHNVMKVFNGQKQSIAKFNKINQKLYQSAWKSQFLSGLMMPVMNFIGNLGYVAIAILGGWLAINNRVKIGDIQAFIQYVRQFNQPIAQTANIANVLQSTAAAAERVFEFLDEKEETPEVVNPVKLTKTTGHISFKDVVFGYHPDKTIIKNFSAEVKPGQRVAIVGPTGAGKTTIVNLLMRFYEVNCGVIEIDGINVQDFTRHDLRSLFGMVLQDTWLFNGTIKENLRYGNHKATNDEVISAARAAHVDHFVRALPKGYQLELNEEADNLSQGEKQLLTIARAMLADPPILILDEATSSVDTRTEVLIQKAMENLMKGKTSFVIAHRLSTIRDADLILVMNEGNIVEQGTHRELITKQGFYANLYNSQFASN